jgi:hypothetical protein
MQQPLRVLIVEDSEADTLAPEKAQALGIDAFCLKPIVARDLSLMIRQVLSSSTSCLGSAWLSGHSGVALYPPRR